MSSQALSEASPTLAGFDAAVGFTVQQHLFSRGITRAHLGELLGVPGQSISSRLRGKVRWTAGDLAVAAELFGVGVADLYPTRSAEGWIPAPYVPGTSKAPTPGGAEAGAVPPVGLEPTTFGLKVRRPVIVWIEYIGVLATHWLTMRAIVSRQSLPHQLAQLAYHDPTAARLPLD